MLESIKKQIGFVKHHFMVGVRQQAAKRAAVTPLFSNVKYKDVFVYTSNDFVLAHTGTIRVPNAVTTIIEGSHCIFINEKFKTLSEDLQDIIFAHEYAHIQLQHAFQTEIKSHILMEFEADLYARDVLGADVENLLLHFLSSKGYKASRIQFELNARLDNIRRIHNVEY